MRPLNIQGDRTMIKLNHTNLPVSNVPELTRFFQAAFGFRIAAQRGLAKFVVLIGEDGFALVLSHDKTVTSTTYPALFHVGFLVDSYEKVREHHSHITEAGFDSPEPAVINRGGNKVFGFYCHAPGGVMVEVSTPAA
jgi:catechol 2,3-dioxygenase-like lactoylglutathione lyase family enzyme